MVKDEGANGRPPRRVRRMIGVLVSPDEYAELRQRAAASGYRTSLSGYCREALLRQAAPKGTAPAINLQEYGRLAHLASNINQAVRHLNVGNIVTSEDVPALRALFEETRDELDRLRRALLEGSEGR